MININSKQIINTIRKNLETSIISLDDMYNQIKNELEKEILQNKQQSEQASKETHDVYDKLSFDFNNNGNICKKLINSRLPWAVKLLNKIRIYGFKIERTNYISIFASFNNKDWFTMEFHISDIREYY